MNCEKKSYITLDSLLCGNLPSVDEPCRSRCSFYVCVTRRGRIKRIIYGAKRCKTSVACAEEIVHQTATDRQTEWTEQ